MKKLIFSISVSLLSATASFAQMPLYGQYMMNPYLINPAVAGISNHVEFQAGYRNQWVSFEGAPTTYWATVHAPVDFRGGRYAKKDYNHNALGGQVYVDQTGPIQRLGLMASFTHHMPLNRQYKLSMGASLGFRQYGFDRAKISVKDDKDNIINSLQNLYTFDGNAGIWIHEKNLWGGLSAVNLLSFTNFAYINSFGMIGYRFQATRHMELLPSTVIRYSPAVPVQADINIKLRYAINKFDKIWGGGSVRTNRTIALMAGAKISDIVTVGYAYDTPWNYIKNFQSASHEIFIRYDLKEKQGVWMPTIW